MVKIVVSCLRESDIKEKSLTLPEPGYTGASLANVINNIQFSMGFHITLLI